MADGLANEWGTNLVFLDAKNRRKYMDRAVTLLEAAIRRTTDEKFALRKIASCGSDANLHAVAETSLGQTDAVLIGCGMYVAGDKGPLQQWSTNGFDITSGPSLLLSQRKHALHSQRNTWLLSHISSRYRNTRTRKS